MSAPVTERRTAYGIVARMSNEQIVDLVQERDHLRRELDTAAILHAEELRTVERERDGWQETAAQYSRNEDYYRGLVDRIGAVFGVEARTADDGGVHDSILRAKVPELVEQLPSRLVHEFAGYLSVLPELPPTRGEAYPWQELAAAFLAAREPREEAEAPVDA